MGIMEWIDSQYNTNDSRLPDYLYLNLMFCKEFYNLDEFQDFWFKDLIRLSHDYLTIAHKYAVAMGSTGYIRAEDIPDSFWKSDRYTAGFYRTLFPVSVDGLKRLKFDGVYAYNPKYSSLNLSRLGHMKPRFGVKVSMTDLIDEGYAEHRFYNEFKMPAWIMDHSYDELVKTYKDKLKSEEEDTAKIIDRETNFKNMITNTDLCKIIGLCSSLYTIFSDNTGPLYFKSTGLAKDIEGMYKKFKELGDNSSLNEIIKEHVKDENRVYDIYTLLAPCTNMGVDERPDRRFLERNDRSLLSVQGLTRLKVLNETMKTFLKELNFKNQVMSIKTLVKKKKKDQQYHDSCCDSDCYNFEELYDCCSTLDNRSYCSDEPSLYDYPVKNNPFDKWLESLESYSTTVSNLLSKPESLGIDRSVVDRETGFIFPSIARHIRPLPRGRVYQQVEKNDFSSMGVYHSRVWVLGVKNKGKGLEAINDLSSSWHRHVMTKQPHEVCKENTMQGICNGNDKIRLSDYSLSILALKEIETFIHHAEKIIPLTRFMRDMCLNIEEKDQKEFAHMKEMKSYLNRVCEGLMLTHFKFKYYLLTNVLFHVKNSSFNIDHLKNALAFQDDLVANGEHYKEVIKDMDNPRIKILNNYYETADYVNLYQHGSFTDSIDRYMERESKLITATVPTETIWPYTDTIRNALKESPYWLTGTLGEKIANRIKEATNEITFLGIK